MPIELHHLRPAPGSKHRTKRLGRGNASGKGTTAGKGTKGQRARQGGRKGLRGLGMKFLIQSTPKLGGFIAIHTAPVDLVVSSLNRFPAGSTVSVRTLIDAGMVSRQTRRVKLIGGGKVTRKLTVLKMTASESAKKQIEAAGGSISQ